MSRVARIFLEVIVTVTNSVVSASSIVSFTSSCTRHELQNILSKFLFGDTHQLVIIVLTKNEAVCVVKREIKAFFGHFVAFSLKLDRLEDELLTNSIHRNIKIPIRRNFSIVIRLNEFLARFINLSEAAESTLRLHFLDQSCIQTDVF